MATEQIAVVATANDHYKSGTPSTVIAASAVLYAGYGTGATILFRNAILKFPIAAFADRLPANLISATFDYEVVVAGALGNQLWFDGLVRTGIDWGDVSWDNRDDSVPTAWDTPGGTPGFGSVETVVQTSTGAKSLDVTQCFLDEWANVGPDDHLAFILHQSAPTSTGNMQIASITDATGKVKPTLTLVFAVAGGRRSLALLVVG